MREEHDTGAVGNDPSTATVATLGGNLCPVCAHQIEARIDVHWYRLFACRRCGCWSSDALMRGAATSFEPCSYFSNVDVDRDRWRDLLKRVAGRAAPLRSVLDVGCGRGGFLTFIAKEYPHLRSAGVELDPERAAAARAANPKATIAAGDAVAALRELPGSFDLITLWDVLEHLPEPRAVLAALAGRLTPGGCIFFQTVHEQSIVPTLGRLSYALSGGRLRFFARRTHEAHHLVFFSKDGLTRLADAAGLAIRDQWFDRLLLARMDGGRVLTTATAVLLALENRLGNGLFINCLLERRAAAPAVAAAD